jgi:hypothetical protein
VAKGGQRVDISLTVSPVRDEDGVIIGASKIARDIRARKQAEGQLRDANRRKDEFLATLSHELRNPLAPIRSVAELLKRAEDLAPDLRAAISKPAPGPRLLCAFAIHSPWASPRYYALPTQATPARYCGGHSHIAAAFCLCRLSRACRAHVGGAPAQLVLPTIAASSTPAAKAAASALTVWFRNCCRQSVAAFSLCASSVKFDCNSWRFISM